MKRFMAFVIFLALAVILIPGLNPAKADQVDVYQNNQLVKSVVFKIGVPYYVVDGLTPGVKMDVAPFIQNDRTYVPVRFLGNALGVDDSNITWDNPTKTATLKGANATLQMTIGKAQIVSNGQAKVIDVVSVLTSDRTFLPARWVAEGLGYEVGWDETTQTVVCWPAGQEKPDVSTAVDWLTRVQQPVQGSTVNGYVIPENTELNISPVGKDGDPEGYIVFSIVPRKGNLQQQYADAESILSQTLDADTVEAVMNYAKQANVRDNDNRLPPIKTFNASNGMAVRVAGGDVTVQFDVWQTKN